MRCGQLVAVAQSIVLPLSTVAIIVFPFVKLPTPRWHKNRNILGYNFKTKDNPMNSDLIADILALIPGLIFYAFALFLLVLTLLLPYFVWQCRNELKAIRKIMQADRQQY